MRGCMRRRGDAWGLRVILGVDPASGKKRSVTRSVRGGKRDAERTLAQTFEIDRFYVRLQASGDRVGHRRSEAHHGQTHVF